MFPPLPFAEFQQLTLYFFSVNSDRNLAEGPVGLQYSRFKKNSEEHSNQWTSYSDLFLGLSVVFLLLYVTSSLRTGTAGLHQQVEKERLTQQVDDLQNQLKVYNTIRQDQIKESNEKEQELYQNLMSKLNLLQDEAKTEKDKLRQQALQNEQKEEALNQYQQLVRNMINANVLAKSKIKRKDEVIVQKNQQLNESKQEIGQLQNVVQDQESEISKKEMAIALAKQQLTAKENQIKNAYKSQKLTKKAYEQQLANLYKEKSSQISQLEQAKRQTENVLAEKRGQLAQVEGELQKTKSVAEQKDKQNKALVGELEKSKGQYQAQLDQLKSQYNAEKSNDAKKASQLAGQINDLQGKMKTTEGQLAKALAEANARKNIASEIKAGFARAGIKAEVDGDTGDVMLDFGDHYFDSGRADLKSEMVGILKKAFPIYASSLYENPKVKMKPSSVEIIGFASPTYKGKLIDPTTLNPGDRKAVDYNLDLSFARARSIFQYLFDKSKMSYKYQEEMLPLVKVTGRSFLADSKNFRGIANQDRASFCEQYDCKKAQRVIIKFGFEK